MGEAKRRAAHNASPFTLLTDAARSEKLGIDPFPTAFDFIYGMVEAVFTKAGGSITSSSGSTSRTASPQV